MNNTETKLEIAKAMLLMRFPFFGYIVSRLNISRDDKVGTFAIDSHCNVSYNHKFLQLLSDENLLAVLAHEALHAVFMHFTHFSKDINHTIMNLAMDIEINDILVNLEKMGLHTSNILDFDGSAKQNTQHKITGFAPDKNGDFIVICKKKKHTIKCRNKSSIEIYDELYDILKDIIKEPKRICVPIPDGKDGANNNNANSSNGGDTPSSNNIKGFDEHNFGELSDSEKLEETTQWGEILIGADVYQESINPEKKRSPNGSWYQRYIDKILKPQVDWRAVLRKHLIELIPFNYTYNIPAKKSYAINVYEPKILRKPLGVTVCIDVSGSISDKELQTFLSEVVGVAKSAPEIAIRRLYWSTIVDEKNDQVFTRKDLSKLFTPAKNIHSTGGTEISCVQEYLKQHRNRNTENLVIYLTDGYVENNPQMNKKSFVVVSKSGSVDIFKQAKIPCVQITKD